MRTRGHGPVAERVAVFFGRLGEYGWIWFVIGFSVSLFDADHRGEWQLAGLLGPAAIGINLAVKLVVRRPRPVLEGLPPLGGAPTSLSFPSAHATSSFACATAMTRIAPEAAVLFLLAFAIAGCRPYLGMHYPSDVLAGAVLGVALGWLCHSAWSTDEDRHRRLAERGQVHPVQRADRRRGRDGRTSLHHDRPECRGRRGPRRPPRPGRARWSAPRRWWASRSTSTTSRAWFPVPRRGRGSATASSRRSARPTRSAM